MASLSPVSIVALRPLACGAVAWRSQGALRVTIIVKATIGLVAGGDARLVAPSPLTLSDRPRGGRAGASLEAASDLAPFLANAGVTVIGAAHAPGGKPVAQMTTALSIHRERPLLEKTVYVYGDRVEAARAPQPFTSMPLVYERAYGGAGVPENPVGVGAAPGDRGPNLVDAKDPRRPAAVGPVASTWAPRARRVAERDLERLHRPIRWSCPPAWISAGSTQHPPISACRTCAATSGSRSTACTHSTRGSRRACRASRRRRAGRSRR